LDEIRKISPLIATNRVMVSERKNKNKAIRTYKKE
jgi:hypothetical protein